VYDESYDTSTSVGRERERKECWEERDKKEEK
jgi:hypothetical protein